MKQVKTGIAVIIEKDGKILMGKRNVKHKHGQGTWCAPGGEIEHGESFENAVRREVKEETNARVKNINFLGVTNDIFKKEGKHYITLWFRADHASGVIKSTKELQHVGWYPTEQLPKPLFLCTINYQKKLYVSNKDDQPTTV